MQAKFKILTLFLLVYITNITKGQDIHFSQYFNNPLNMNPSETGNFDGDWRLYGNFRDQWKAISYPFRTFSLGYDQKMQFSDQHLSLGGYIMSDNSGNPALKCYTVYFSGAYEKTFDHNEFRGGLQAGFVMKSVNYDKFTFPDDWNGDESRFDPGYTIDENDRNQLSYLDINLGMGWKRKFGKLEPEAGVALFHVNMPTESFEGTNPYKIPMRFLLNGSVRAELNSTLYIKPGLLISSMSGARNIMFGSQAGKVVQGNRFGVREIYAGLYLRNGLVDPADAFMVMAGAQVGKIAVNVSYDVNVSSLHTYTNSRGAFEISFVYKSISALIKTFTIPCERI